MNKKIKSSLVNKDMDISEAIQAIDKGGIGIAFVINEKNLLLGTITDGDIRRALIKNKSLSSKVTFIMNRKFKSMTTRDNIDLVKVKMAKLGINQMPVLDNKKRIVDVIVYNEINKKLFPNTVFILAGGFGKRMLPLTKNTPKPMLKISGKPLLELLILDFIKYGFTNFILSTYYKSSVIKNFFKDGKQMNINISYIKEDSPLGTAGSLGLIDKDTLSMPIIVTNSDLVTNVNYESLLKAHIKANCDMTIGITKYNYRIPYGAIKIKNKKIIKIDEKPIFTHNINAGIYVVNSNIIKKIKKNKNLSMTNLINSLVKSNKKLNPFLIYEKWRDIGTFKDFSSLINK
jgi:dTDP-glucose pyrophosphorylase/predicted transcriptional regulator